MRSPGVNRIGSCASCAPGLWHRKAPHPQWEPTEPWDQNVTSYAIDDGEPLLLFDPLSVPPEIEQLAIVLTAPWHERDAQSLVERLGVPVYTPLPDTAEDLLRQFDFTAPEGWISPDVRWLPSVIRTPAPAWTVSPFAIPTLSCR